MKFSEYMLNEANPREMEILTKIDNSDWTEKQLDYVWKKCKLTKKNVLEFTKILNKFISILDGRNPREDEILDEIEASDWTDKQLDDVCFQCKIVKKNVVKFCEILKLFSIIA